jgi:hypothetical protein
VVTAAGGSVETADLADGAVTFPKLADAAIVTESEGISANDNDTTIPTSAAVLDHVANNAGGITASSYGSSGYVQFSDGLIIQWGQDDANRSGQSVTFPITFLTNAYNVHVTGNGNFSAWGTSLGTSGFTIHRDGTSLGPAWWVAIGD